MPNITYSDKTTGGTFTAADANEIKSVINQNAGLLPTAITDSTGAAVQFDVRRRYGTIAAPITGAITFNSAGFVNDGPEQMMIHESATSPLPLSAPFDLVGGQYKINVKNYFFFHPITASKVLVTISQSV